jgi:Ca2+-binding EF-hand superfamily protein
MQQRKKPPDMTKDQLTEMQGKLKAEGKDTSNLDKIVASFDQLDTNQDGKVGMEELKAGAAELGIELPEPRHGGKPPDLTKDQLSKISEKLKADGKDTSNLDKLISSFDQLDTNQDGKVSLDELQSGSEKLGIEMPQPPVGKGRGAGASEPEWGPPPGLLGDGDSSRVESQSPDGNSRLLRMLQRFEQSNPESSGSSADSSVSYAA